MRECFLECLFLIGRETRPPVERVRKLETGEREREIGIGNDVAWRNNVHSDCPSLSLYAWMCLC